MKNEDTKVVCVPEKKPVCKYCINFPIIYFIQKVSYYLRACVTLSYFSKLCFVTVMFNFFSFVSLCPIFFKLCFVTLGPIFCSYALLH